MQRSRPRPPASSVLQAVTRAALGCLLGSSLACSAAEEPSSGVDGNPSASTLPQAPGAPTDGSSPVPSTTGANAVPPLGSGPVPTESPSQLGTIEIVNDPKRVLSRLTRAQFLTSVSRLLGPQSVTGLAELVPDSIPNGGYGNSGFAQSQAYDVALGFDAAARKAIENLTDLSALHQTYGGCTQFDCISTFAERFMAAAFRRPPTAVEIASIQPIVDAALADGASYDRAVGLVVRAVLQSPEFLYLFEDEVLTADQLATRLSFFLTDAPPDEELSALAADGSLSTPAVFAAQTDRLLASSEAFARAFAYDYLTLRRAYQRTFGLEASAIDPLVDSATGSFAKFLTDDAELGALFTTTQFAVNPQAAQFMNAASPDEPLLQTASSYPFLGLLTHPAVLMAMSNAVEGSTVSRGQFIAHQLLCVPPTPPPSADLIAQELTDDQLPENPTQRDEAEARLRAPTCLGCHLQFEPYAFGLNKWGGDGTFKDDPRFNDGGPILTSLGSFEFENYRDYLPQLAGSEQYRRCITDHFLRYALRHTAYPSELIDEVLSAASVDGAQVTFRKLARAVALQPAFTAR